MNAIDYALGLVAIGCMLGVWFFFIEPSTPLPAAEVPTLSWDAHPFAQQGEPFTLLITGTNLRGKIISLSTNQGDFFSYTCEQNPCTFSQEFTFEKTGIHTLKLYSPPLDTLTLFQNVRVLGSQSICLDGTPEGSCSSSLKLCQNATLIENCSVCGCLDGSICVENGCILPPTHVSILEPLFPKTIFVGKAQHVIIPIQNDSPYDLDGIFTLILTTHSASGSILGTIPQQIKITTLSSGSVQTFDVSVSFTKETAGFRAQLYGNTPPYPHTPLLYETPILAVQPILDTVAPDPISGLTYETSPDGIILSWNASPSADVDHYQIYAQTTSNGAFTTYHPYASTPDTEYTLPFSGDSLAYTVSAIDMAGNESNPSNPILVSAP